MQTSIKIYTDGGCTGNPGPGGWAAVILEMGAEPVQISGGSSHTTNNRMELTAVIEALSRLNPEFRTVEVVTDSQYVQKGISQWMDGWIAKNWKNAAGKPVKNRDLWVMLKNISDGKQINWTWVKGHAGNPWNERCDQLVALERNRFADGASNQNT